MLLALTGAMSLSAEKYIVVTGDATLYDQPSTKGTATLSFDNTLVKVSRGMLFRGAPGQAGWNKIEYLSGIHAFLSDSASDTACSIPEPGEYKVSNGGGTVTFAHDGKNFTLTAGGKSYTGRAADNGVIFTDMTGNITYSAVRYGGVTYIFNYTSLNW